MVKNTLNIGKISEGFVLDHIEAGKSMDIYKYLKLDKLDCCVAIIKNAKSNKMGKKDIIKIECPIDIIDLDILGFIDHNITINIIENEEIVDKKALTLPKEIKNVIKCKNRWRAANEGKNAESPWHDEKGQRPSGRRNQHRQTPQCRSPWG